MLESEVKCISVSVFRCPFFEFDTARNLLPTRFIAFLIEERIVR